MIKLTVMAIVFYGMWTLGLVHLILIWMLAFFG